MMEEINRNNYEAWMLDLSEGRLSQEGQDALRDFLLKNPDCDVSGLENPEVRLRGPELSFDNRASLRREFIEPGDTVSRENFQMACLARLEGELDPEQLSAHNELIAADPELEKEWLLWEQSRLPASEIVFPGKRKLKKATTSMRRVIWLAPVAAAAAVFLGIVILRDAPFGTVPEQELTMPLATSEPVDVIQQEETTDENTQKSAAEINKTTPRPFIQKYHESPIPDEASSPVKGSETVNQPDAVYPRIPESLPVRMDNPRYALSSHVDREYRDRIRPIEFQSYENQAFALDDYAEADLRTTVKEFAEKKNISALSLADAGINRIGQLTGSELAMETSRDQEGNVSGFRFRSRIITVSAPMGKSK